LKKYEAVFILDIRKVEDDGNTFSQELKDYVEKNLEGRFESSLFLGRKQFAREIRKRKGGIYWSYVFETTPEAVGGIRNRFRLDERVLRMLIIHYDRPNSSEVRA
jgi:small subunit ribosomal protein S6